MAKIATATVEIKPVVNEEALAALIARVENEVRAAVQRGLGKGSPDSWQWLGMER